MFSRLLALFIIVPILELYFFVTLGKLITFPVTLLIIIATAILGAYLTKREGLSVLARMKESSAQGKLPHQEVIDGALILFAGALLLTPGFLTDSLGFSLLFPPTRALYRGYAAHFMKGKIKIMPSGVNMPGTTPRPDPELRQNGQNNQPKQSKDGEVIDVEVL